MENNDRLLYRRLRGGVSAVELVLRDGTKAQFRSAPPGTHSPWRTRNLVELERGPGERRSRFEHQLALAAELEEDVLVRLRLATEFDQAPIMSVM